MPTPCDYFRNPVCRTLCRSIARDERVIYRLKQMGMPTGLLQRRVDGMKRQLQRCK